MQASRFARAAALFAFAAGTLAPATVLAQATPQPTDAAQSPVASGCGVVPGASAMFQPTTTGNTTRQPFTAEAGVPFSLTLASNRTTGYSWQLLEPLDSTVLELESHTYQQRGTTPAGQQIVGAPGVETFTFYPLCAGATTIALIYKRPWEPTSPDDQRRIYDVVVQ
jgi:predicted secreted protein